MAKKVGFSPDDISPAMFKQELNAAIDRATKKLGQERGSLQMIFEYLGTSKRQLLRWRNGIGPSRTQMAKLFVKLKAF